MTFVLSKMLWGFVAPGSLLVFALTVGLVLRTAPSAQWARMGRILSLGACVCLLTIATLPVGEWALMPLENRFAFDPPEQVDGIIIIGGDERTEISEDRGQPTALESLRRYVTTLDLSRRYPDAKLVFSGGAAHPRPYGKILDSDVARVLMTDMGVPTDRMVFEKTSRNTFENAVLSADIVRPEASQKWLLVTSAWHMPRAIGCFRKAGWNVYAAPAGYVTDGQYRFRILFDFDEQLHLLTVAAHEYTGLVAYWLMGRTSALWPA
jgi:uncharacterized SAM-binding protein YcdF (DUF218 family)